MEIDSNVVISVIYPAFLGLSLIISTTVFIFFTRRIPQPGARSAAWMMGSVIVWLIGSIIEVTSNQLSIQTQGLAIQYIGKVFVPLAWFTFSLQYYSYDEIFTRRKRVLSLVIPVITILLSFSNSFHNLMWTDLQQESIGTITILVKQYGIWPWVFTPYNYLLMVGGAIVIGSRLAGNALLFRLQGTAFISALIIPLVLNLMYYFRIPIDGMDLTPCAFSVSGMIMAFAFFKLRLFDIRPLAYDTIIHNMSTGVIVLDTRDRITGINNAAETIVGSTLNILTGKHISSLQQFGQDIIKYYTHPEEGIREFAIKKNDATNYYELKVSPLYDKRKRFIGRMILLDNVTERRIIENRNRELEEMANQTSRLVTAGEIAADIAHEINNPLTSILGFSDWLLQHDIPENIKSDIQIINEAAKRAADVTARLLSFTGRYDIRQEYVDINHLIETTLELRTRSFVNNNIGIIKEMSPELPGIIANAGQLQQVFLNLLLNAEAAMKESHGRGTLLIKTEKQGQNIRISFKDDGPGISTDYLEKIFQPFFTTKAQGKGTGLGLNICRRIIKQHSGILHAESKPGNGATFVVELPVLSKSVQEAVPRPAPPEDNDIVPTTEIALKNNATIIIVDDEPMILEIMEKFLHDEGYKVTTISDSSEAFQLMQTSVFDLALVDVRMPGISGIELYTRLKNMVPEAARKIAFITGDSIGIDTNEFLTVTGVRYIVKPFKTAKLRNFLRHTLNELNRESGMQERG